ncbi:hypothetical protein [Salarchaeum sp. JOR-1]|uniref:hypothetical protein n=1 Tax=Salarchaeum sp. JOR-1 TaxID=2599399 RepID=UPI001F0DD1AA|nr:hypothetical protein [Salarchaeum sp. JOR-1]
MDFEAAVARTLEHIDASSGIHPANKKLIHDYHRDMILSDISIAQQQKLMSRFKILAEQVGQARFDELQKEDLVDLVAWLYTRGTTDATVIEYKQAIKQLWKWMNGGEEPEETNWIRRSRSSYAKLLPHNLLEKPVNPHHFRHSRATYLANYLTEAQMCEWFGWARGSRVPGRYVHLSGRDIDHAYVATLAESGYEHISSNPSTLPRSGSSA